MNAPDRFELIVLPAGVDKVTVKKDTKVPNAATIIVEREDHTMGNLLRSRLMEHQQVLFAGYRMPHPLEPHFELRVQTKREITPVQAVNDTLDRLLIDVKKLDEKFKTEINRMAPQRGDSDDEYEQADQFQQQRYRSNSAMSANSSSIVDWA